MKVGDRVFLIGDHNVRGRICHIHNNTKDIGVDLGEHGGSHDCNGHCPDMQGYYFKANELQVIIRKKLKQEDLIL